MNIRKRIAYCIRILPMTNPIFKPWIEIALREIGVKEEGANTGKRIREYQAATSLGGTGWPWCAAFVSWALLKGSKWNPRQASVFGLRDWGNENGLFRPKTDFPKSGWVVLFDFEPNKDGGTHCGFVTYPLKDFMITLEGNTSVEKVSGVYSVSEERNGGIVAERKRNYGPVIGWIALE